MPVHPAAGPASSFEFDARELGIRNSVATMSSM